MNQRCRSDDVETCVDVCAWLRGSYSESLIKRQKVNRTIKSDQKWKRERAILNRDLPIPRERPLPVIVCETDKIIQISVH